MRVGAELEYVSVLMSSECLLDAWINIRPTMGKRARTLVRCLPPLFVLGDRRSGPDSFPMALMLQCWGVDVDLAALIDELCMSVGRDKIQRPSDIEESETYLSLTSTWSPCSP